MDINKISKALKNLGESFKGDLIELSKRLGSKYNDIKKETESTETMRKE